VNPFPARSIFALGAVLALVFSPPVARAAGMNRGFNQLLDAVVRIDVRELAFEAGARRFTAGIGSGVILTADGLVLTNAHVASPRSVEIDITLANLEHVNAKLVGWDHWTDLALLRVDMVEVKRRNWTLAHADFIPENETLFPGETVYAVGTPHGLTRTVTRGIISNTSQYLEDIGGINGYETGMFNTWLQTDAAINPGNSGGPLVTEDGKVIGITARGFVGANNLGFAIPASTARRVVAGLLRDGAITRSYIGLSLEALRDFENFYALGVDQGVLLSNVDPGSPAAKAGLRGSDILLAINGARVDGRFPEQLPGIQNTVASAAVGSTLKLSIRRGNDTRDYDVVTEKLESRIGEEGVLEKWGLSVRKVSRTYAREKQLDSEAGVLVIGVQPGYPADVAGLSRGDIITKINQQAVTSLDVAKKAQETYDAKPAPTLLETQRDRRVSLYILKP
jgi:serine protease Do